MLYMTNLSFFSLSFHTIMTHLQEYDTLLLRSTSSPKGWWRWLVLLSFSLFSFSSALMLVLCRSLDKSLVLTPFFLSCLLGGSHLHPVSTSLCNTTFNMKAQLRPTPSTRCLQSTWWFIHLLSNLRLNTLKIDWMDHCHRVMDWGEVYWLALAWMLWQVVFDGWEPFRPCMGLPSCSWVKRLQLLVRNLLYSTCPIFNIFIFQHRYSCCRYHLNLQ